MSWKKLLQEHKVHHHRTSLQEVNELRKLIARDLSDAGIPELSEDRRFATAYNAALQTAKMAIACAGYRIASVPGHHRLTFEGAKLALGNSAAQLTDYFDSCRRKRNEIDYTGAAITTGTEAEKVLLHAGAFFEHVERWIEANHTSFRR